MCGQTQHHLSQHISWQKRHGNWHGMQIVAQRADALAALRAHCPVIDSKHYHITENHVEGSKQRGATGFWIEPLTVIEHHMSFGTRRGARQTCAGSGRRRIWNPHAYR